MKLDPQVLALVQQHPNTVEYVKAQLELAAQLHVISQQGCQNYIKDYDPVEAFEEEIRQTEEETNLLGITDTELDILDSIFNTYAESCKYLTCNDFRHEIDKWKGGLFDRLMYQTTGGKIVSGSYRIASAYWKRLRREGILEQISPGTYIYCR